MKGKLFLVLILLFSNLAFICAANQVDLVYFYGQGCPHCAKLESFLEDLKVKYPELNAIGYETYFNEEDRDLFLRLAEANNQSVQGVPTTFIGNETFVGFSDNIGVSLENKIIYCSEVECSNPLSVLEGNIPEGEVIQVNITNSSQGLLSKLTIPVVVSAAIVDAINPCAFAVLIILLSTILISSDKKRALFAGLLFSLSVFISYFLMGVGLFSAIAAAGVTRTFYIVVSILAIVIGLFNLKDYLWYGKWFKMEVPESWRPAMKGFIQRVTSPLGAFFVGFIVSLFLLPCTSGPYIVILGLLSSTATRASAMWYLVLYNLIFILPMILITLGVYFGFMNVKDAESFRTRKLRVLHLIAGAIILVIGIVMLGSVYLGYI